MPLSTTLGKIALSGLLATGVLGTFKLAHDNGFLDMMQAQMRASRATVPGTNISLRTHWTGVASLDQQTIAILSFFTILFEPSNVGMLLQGIYFYGTFISTWILMQVEGYRVGNTWRIISWVTIFGLLAENVALAIVLPLWSILHLFTSPTVGQSKTATIKRTGLLVHPIELKVIPWSVAVGLGVPSVMLAVSSIEETQPLYLSKQFWIVVRQFHPLITAVVHLVLSVFTRASSVQYDSAEQRDRDVMRSLQGVYTIASYASIVPHIAIATLAGGATLFPFVFSPGYQALFDPVRIFKPVLFWTVHPARVATFADGATQFLQWDGIVSCLTVLVWAFAVNRDALPTRRMGSGFLVALLKTAATVVLGGPGAAAVALIQERDSAVLEPIADSEKQKKTA